MLRKHGLGGRVVAPNHDASVNQQRASCANLCIEHPLYGVAGVLDLELALERPHAARDADERLSVDALYEVVVGVQQGDRQGFFLLELGPRGKLLGDS